MLSARHAVKNSKALFGLSLFLITCLLIFSNLWKFASARYGDISFNHAELLWYIAFNEWLIVSLPDVQDEMEEDFRSGKLAYLLPRPINYLGATFSSALGELVVNLIFLGSVTFLFTWYTAGCFPFDALGFVLILIGGFLAGVLSILFQMSIGLSAFWLHDINPLYWVYEKLLFMLGGLMLPLSVYPDWIQKIAAYSPFPTILGERSALAINYGLEKVIALFLSLALWVLIAVLLLNGLFKRGLRILNVEGG